MKSREFLLCKNSERHDVAKHAWRGNASVPARATAARTRRKANGLRRDVAERFVEAFGAGHGKAGMSGFVMSFLGFLYGERVGERRNTIHKWGGALVAVFSYSPKLLSYGEI